MVSAKIFAIFGTVAATTLANPLVASDMMSFEDARAEVLLNVEATVWPSVEADLKFLFPGIQCQLAAHLPATNLTAYSSPNEDCKAVEGGLVHLFPSIQCQGSIDWDQLEASAATIQPLGSLETRQENKNRGHVDSHHRGRLQEIKKAESDTILSCSKAPRPGNCRICAAGYAVAAVSEIGVCAAIAYGAAAATAGILTPVAWAGFATCSGAMIANMFASLTGCWGR